MSDVTTKNILNIYLKHRIIDICKELNIEYLKDYEKYNIDTVETKRKKETKRNKKVKCKCKARVKNDGWGKQCSRNSLDGSEFCGPHSKKKKTGIYSWEVFGRIDECAPKCFVGWYKKKGIIVKNETNFYAKNIPNELSLDDRKQFNLCL